QGRPAGVAARRSRPAPLLARPIRTGALLCTRLRACFLSRPFLSRPLAPPILLAAPVGAPSFGALRIGKELTLVGAVRTLAPALVALIALLLALTLALFLAFAHEPRLDREGVERPVLLRRRMDAIAEAAQDIRHLRLRAADQGHHLRCGAEPTRRQHPLSG